MPIPCDFNLGESKHDKARDRPKCQTPAENQIHIGDKSWLHVCNIHLKEWAMFNGAKWYAAKRAGSKSSHDDFLVLAE